MNDLLKRMLRIQKRDVHTATIEPFLIYCQEEDGRSILETVLWPDGGMSNALEGVEARQWAQFHGVNPVYDPSEHPDD